MKTFCFKLYKAKRNRKLHRQINAAGLIYNHCIALHKRYYRLYHKSLNVYVLQKHLTKLKKIPRFSYLKEIGSQAVQDITQRIDRAYKLFFRNLKRKIRTAPPSFKKVRKYKSYTLKQTGWKLLKKMPFKLVRKSTAISKAEPSRGRSKPSPSSVMRLGISIFISSVRRQKMQSWPEQVKASAMTLALSGFSQHRTGTIERLRYSLNRMPMPFVFQSTHLV